MGRGFVQPKEVKKAPTRHAELASDLIPSSPGYIIIIYDPSCVVADFFVGFCQESDEAETKIARILSDFQETSPNSQLFAKQRVNNVLGFLYELGNFLKSHEGCGMTLVPEHPGHFKISENVTPASIKLKIRRKLRCISKIQEPVDASLAPAP